MTDAPFVVTAYVIVATILVMYAAHLRRRIRTALHLHSVLRSRTGGRAVEGRPVSVGPATRDEASGG